MLSIVSKMNNSIGVGYVYLLLGVLMFFAGGYLAKSTSDFVENALSVEGTVIELVHEEEMLYPVVGFQGNTDKYYTFKSNFGCSPACYKEQEKVTVLYSDSKEEKPKISSFMSLWSASLLLFGVGLSFVVVSLLQIKRVRRSRLQNFT